MSEVEEFVEDGLTLYRFEGDKYLFNPLEQKSANEVVENREESANDVADSEEEKEKKQGSLDAIVGSGKSKSEEETPECKHCGEFMDEAPDIIESDWLCHNNGCEGSFQEEEIEDENQEELLWDGSE